MSKASDAKFPIVKIEDEAHFDSLVAESDKKVGLGSETFWLALV